MHATIDTPEFAQAALVVRNSMTKLSPNAQETIRHNVNNDEWLDCQHFGIGQWVRGCLKVKTQLNTEDLEAVWKDVLKSAVNA